MAQEKTAFDNLTFLNSANAEYVVHLYGEYLASPGKVDASWQQFFGGLNDSEATLLKELAGASWTPAENRKSLQKFEVKGAGAQVGTVPPAAKLSPANDGTGVSSREDMIRATKDSIAALMLVRAYRARGHLMANLDPLGLKEIKSHAELDPAYYGFTKADETRPIYVGGVLGMDFATIPDIVKALKKVYCSTIGIEFLHLVDPDEKNWLQERIESPRAQTSYTRDEKIDILTRLNAAEIFEQFLHKKYPGTKRFGVDGGEALIPCIEQVLKTGVEAGVQDVIVGMAHRGRLNVLANVMGKPFTAIFSEFQGKSSMPDDVQGSGDVKYHLGTSSDRNFGKNSVHLSLTANPSHLEFVNPVVIGKARAKLTQKKMLESAAVMPLLLHGDAAFAGQGITAETLMISELPGYRVGGTVHIVINNQIGFTTMPQYGRSGPYSTDVAKMLAAPIFHVNGDDPEAVVFVAQVATEFRQTFKKDVVIDMYCYRRYGHNEGDEPAFTQPIMYKTIAGKESTRAKYEKQLIAEGVVTADQAKAISDNFTQYLEEAFEATKTYKPNSGDFLGGAWEGLTFAPDGPRRGFTAVSDADLQAIGKILTDIPAGFNINKKLQRVIEAKREMFASGEGFDWATGEALAFGTLLKDGFGVRLSGQDVGRGTFSHRHAIWYDQETQAKYLPLNNVDKFQPNYEVHDSPLSEMAVLGFEYGYSLSDPRTLVMWEAQFGDFVNGAQVIIDQFIASGESKWLRMSGLVMLLPHGMEGQGPEHSSGRLERFLQLCAEDNWQVANCTTPANYFHILRRQMMREFRKPLVLMTPKSLLRHKLAVSKAEEFTGDSTFHRYLWDDDKDILAKPDKIKRVVLCSGKVYYDLLQARRDRKIDDIMILRVEQIYPFPRLELAQELAQYKNAEVIWCQEEPKNQGSWFFVDPLIEETLLAAKHACKRARYVGRVAAAAPATGYLSRHQAEQEKLVSEALSLT